MAIDKNGNIEAALFKETDKLRKLYRINKEYL